ncbi:MAG TPA: hypothetical protein VK642_13220 [Burkholderiales bacterium]|nr:hypothetical protein [Burkholderiales bacterium]
MTEQQWDSLQADIQSLRLFIVAMCQAAPNQKALYEIFTSNLEIWKTASIHSQLSDQAIRLREARVETLVELIWGKGSIPPR